MAKNQRYCSSHKNNRHKDCTLVKYKFENIDEFKKYFGLKLYFYSYKSMFSINNKLIYNREKTFYIDLYNVINTDDNMLNGHFIERSWYSIFLEK